jgi:hypothetical protein
MKTFIRQFLIFATGIGLCSCASYNVAFVKNSDAISKSGKVYILVKDSVSSLQYSINSSANQNNFMKAFSASISDALNRSGIKNTIKIRSNVYSLESDDDINLQIKAYGPDAIMSIRREQSTLTSGKYGSYYNGGIYTICLSAPGAKGPYWKAIVQAFNETYSGVDDYAALAKQIIDKLKADGVI